MPGNFKKEDLRILRTKKVLLTAIFKLLKLRNFNQITVNDLCEEAMISRTAFYSHYNDKYNLLEHLLTDMQSKIITKQYSYDEAEKLVNDFAKDHKMVIKNLVEKADMETSKLLCDFLLPLLNIGISNPEKPDNLNDVIIANFCCGGLLNYLLWQVENNFPKNIQTMNPYIYDVLKKFQQCDEEA